MDSRANYQINIDGNVFVAVQNLFAEFTKIVQVVEQVGESAQASTRQITEHVDKSASAFGNLQNKIRSISLTSVIEQVEKVSTAIASISGPGIGFEQSMADLSSITGIVGDELQDLGKVARQTGKDSGLGAQQAAQAFALLASQIQVDKIGMEGLKVLQQNTITLSHAAGMSMNDAAIALAGTINQFGLQATEANRVINILAAGSKYGAAEIVDLSQSFKVVGAAASAAGLTVEDTAGAIEVLSKNNLKGAEAGTALRNIMLKMQTTLGVDFRKNSFSDALDALKPKLTDATYLSKVFGMENIAAAQFLIKNSDAVAEMTEQVTNTNVAQEQAAIRTDTVQQMMARCQARIDDLKIGFFELTGPAGGYATIIAQQAVTVAQLLPLLGLFGKGIQFITSASKLQTLWTGAVSAATTAWTGVQWLLNASLWACPITWIVAGIAGLIAIVTICVTKVEGWGKQWDSVVNFMKLTGKLFVETIKYEFSTMVNGIMIGLDYIKLGWYKFKNAVGLGDSSENEAMIAKISGDIDNRKQAIVDGAKNLKNLAQDAGKALTWELSWKGGKEAAPQGDTPIMADGTPDGTSTPRTKTPVHIDFTQTGTKSGSKKILDLNKIVPDMKGTAAYTAIASRLSAVKMPSMAATAAALAMPVTVAATSLPQSGAAAPTPTELAYNSSRHGSVSMGKFCDKIEIHIANADGKGYEQIEEEVVEVLKKVMDNYET
jgi:TP901 family phage tail tape measure protein